MPILDMGKSRLVRTRVRPTLGPPPEATEAMRASGEAYIGSAKQRRDLAAVAARAGKRPRKFGVMQPRTISPPGGVMAGSSSSAAGAGGGAVTEYNGETEEAWYMNKWLWAAVIAALVLGQQNRKRR
jgi:hypothetical protein